MDPVDTKDNGDGTTTYTYSLYNGKYAPIINGKFEGKDVVTFKQLFDKKDAVINITITKNQILPEGKSPETIDRSVASTLGDVIGNILVSGNK